MDRLKVVENISAQKECLLASFTCVNPPQSVNCLFVASEVVFPSELFITGIAGEYFFFFAPFSGVVDLEPRWQVPEVFCTRVSQQMVASLELFVTEATRGIPLEIVSSFLHLAQTLDLTPLSVDYIYGFSCNLSENKK